MKNAKLTAKLEACEASLRRNHTRLVRITNKLTKLTRERQRLMRQLAAPEPKLDPVIEAKADLVQAIDDRLSEIVEGKPVASLDIPPFLQRKSVDVAKLAAQRKSKEATARSQMPLTGRAALDAIKPKRKAKA
jgi:chromosome segregation ATPase